MDGGVFGSVRMWWAKDSGPCIKYVSAILSLFTYTSPSISSSCHLIFLLYCSSAGYKLFFNHYFDSKSVKTFIIYDQL